MTEPEPTKKKKRNGSNGGRPPDDEWMDHFFIAYETTHLIAKSAQMAGVSESYVRKQKRENPKFRELFDMAQERSTEVLEQIAVKRAAEGSDLLLIFMLKARRPEVYRDNVKIDHGGQIGHVHATLDQITGGKQPVQISAGQRRKAAALLLEGSGAESHPAVIEGTATSVEDQAA